MKKQILNMPCAKPAIFITSYDLSVKRISFWAKMRHGIFTNGKLSKAFESMREIVGYKYCNQNLYIERYGILFSVGVYITGKNVEVNICCVINNKSVFKISRPYKNGQKFTTDEIRGIDTATATEAHRIFKLS